MLGKGCDAKGSNVWRWWSDSDAAWESVTFEEGLSRLKAAQDSIPTPHIISQGISSAGRLEAPFGGSKILCVGRNYRPHAEELGNTIPKEPLWFMKPASSLAGPDGTILLPSGFGRIDYEGELVLVIGTEAANVSRETALDIVAGVTLAIDVTARELQKADGQWTRAKGFDTFCPLGPVILPFGPWASDARLTTVLNGKTVQDDWTTSLVFSYADLIAHISGCMTLMPGDLILTGTPAGVGPLASGDSIDVSIAIARGRSTADDLVMTLSMSVSDRPSH
ncbi:MAG TPA: fumarylacetoacetate hydrolase family protein [Candidatus Ozemobacteraceae bacterium]|nr:fumarylacetoacetate hydrolase family protein [Candidatus Ozemobacteraceae bacterium]